MSNNQSRSDKAHSNKKRPARIPLSSGNKLHVPAELKEEGYFHYWALDRKGMIEQMEAAYYEKVKDSRGEPVTVPAGGGETHYLMRIEQEYYNEDFSNQQKRNNETTNHTMQKLGESEYIPEGRQAVVEREII
jgi:hypothetical protein